MDESEVSIEVFYVIHAQLFLLMHASVGLIVDELEVSHEVFASYTHDSFYTAR